MILSILSTIKIRSGIFFLVIVLKLGVVKDDRVKYLMSENMTMDF